MTAGSLFASQERLALTMIPSRTSGNDVRTAPERSIPLSCPRTAVRVDVRAMGRVESWPMSDTADLLVAIVGFNPASVLLCARALKAGRTCLICTAETRDLANILKGQIGSATVVEVRAGATITQVAAAVGSAVPSDARRVSLDLTGGTKILSLGAWHALQARETLDLSIAYLDGDGRLFDAASGVSLPRANLMPEDLLRWSGASVRHSRWSGNLKAVPAPIVDRFPVSRALFQHFPDWEVARYAGGERVTGRGIPQTCRGFDTDEHGNYFVPAGSGFLRTNEWLEEYCLCEAARAMGTDAESVGALFGSDLVAGAGGKDEVDIVLTRGARVLVIEAKARLTSKGAGADLHKRVQKARRFFGSHAQVLFVHPAWRGQPPRDLAELADRGTMLVGRDEQRLRAAVRKSLK